MLTGIETFPCDYLHFPHTMTVMQTSCLLRLTSELTSRFADDFFFFFWIKQTIINYEKQ